MFQLNFFTPLTLARGLAAPLARGKGAIVNVTSIAGHAVHPFAGSAYSTSKAALSALTREMAVEFAELGVRVNAVAPGEIETAMLSPETEVLIPRIPLHRLGTPEDVASAIFYLCAADSAYVTGHRDLRHRRPAPLLRTGDSRERVEPRLERGDVVVEPVAERRRAPRRGGGANRSSRASSLSQRFGDERHLLRAAPPPAGGAGSAASAAAPSRL